MNHKNIHLSLVLTLVRRASTLVMKFIQKRNGFTVHKDAKLTITGPQVFFSHRELVHTLKVQEAISSHLQYKADKTFHPQTTPHRSSEL